MKISNETYLRVGDVAKLLGTNEQTVISHADAGRIPFVRHPLNNYRLFRREDINKIAAEIAESLHTSREGVEAK